MNGALGSGWNLALNFGSLSSAGFYDVRERLCTVQNSWNLFHLCEYILIVSYRTKLFSVVHKQ